MSAWSEFVCVIGQDEYGETVKKFLQGVGEQPVISDTSDSYNDPGGKTRFYKFFSSGLEFGFRLGVLNHIHFFVQRHEGYSQYGGEVLGWPAHAWSVQDFIKELGTASRSAPGKVDMLIGRVRQ